MRELLSERRGDVPKPQVAGAQRSMVALERMSTVHLVAVELRKAILTGDLPTGRPIGEVEIAAQLGVSRGPLREAAQRLVQEGLLVSHPGRGMRVRRIAPDEVADLYEARLAVEAHAARRLAQRPERVQTAELEACLARLVAVSEGNEAVPIGDADISFHRELVRLVGSLRLSSRIDTLLAETRIASLSASNGYQVRRSVSPTYRELIDAIASGDGEAAADALSRQFEEAIARLTGKDAQTETVETTLGHPPATFPRLDSP